MLIITTFYDIIQKFSIIYALIQLFDFAPFIFQLRNIITAISKMERFPFRSLSMSALSIIPVTFVTSLAVIFRRDIRTFLQQELFSSITTALRYFAIKDSRKYADKKTSGNGKPTEDSGEGVSASSGQSDNTKRRLLLLYGTSTV